MALADAMQWLIKSKEVGFSIHYLDCYVLLCGTSSCISAGLGDSNTGFVRPWHPNGSGKGIGPCHDFDLLGTATS